MSGLHILKCVILYVVTLLRCGTPLLNNLYLLSVVYPISVHTVTNIQMLG